MELTEFVSARLDEDETVARAAGGEAWECTEYLGSLRVQTVATHGGPGYEEHVGVTHDVEGLSDSVDSEDGAHIARHDPARVLAEVEAMRRIVAEARAIVDDPEKDWGDVDSLDDEHVQAFAFTFRALASIWRDHAAFDPAWAV